MWTYWTMFCVPALASLSPWRLDRSSRLFMLTVTAVLLILVIGFRDHVGMDWDGYANVLREFETSSLGQILVGKEPGFGFINWLSGQFGWGLYAVNVFAAAIFVIGLLAFLLRQPNAWGCLALAVPVLVIQLGMSGIRQACAVGFFCLAMNAFVDRRVFRYLGWALLAFSFHQTAIVLIPLAALIEGRSRAVLIFSVTVLILLILAFAFKGFEFYNEAYIQHDLGGAAGAIPRIAFNVMAAGLFFAFRKRWAAFYPDSRLFLVSAIMVIAIAPFLPFTQVAVDRLEYYLIPFQIAVVSRIQEFLPQRIRVAFMSIVFTGYAAALAVWLNYSWIAQLAWVPYRSILFGTPPSTL